MRNRVSSQKIISGSRIILAVLGILGVGTSELTAGSYGDIYGAHAGAAGMAGAVTATVNNSSAVFYNVAGLGRLNEADLFIAQWEQKEKEKEAAAGGEGAKDANGNPIPQEGPLLNTEPQVEDGGAPAKWYKKAWFNFRDGFANMGKGMFTYQPLL